MRSRRRWTASTRSEWSSKRRAPAAGPPRRMVAEAVAGGKGPGSAALCCQCPVTRCLDGKAERATGRQGQRFVAGGSTIVDRALPNGAGEASPGERRRPAALGRVDQSSSTETIPSCSRASIEAAHCTRKPDGSIVACRACKPMAPCDRSADGATGRCDYDGGVVEVLEGRPMGGEGRENLRRGTMR